MKVKNDDILVTYNGDGSITLSVMTRDFRFIEQTYMFYSLREAKKHFKEYLETINIH